jgi:hypothetical protein
MTRLAWPMFGEDKRRLQAELCALYESDEAVKTLFEALQENVQRHSEQDAYLPALEEHYQRMLDALVMHLSQNRLLHFALHEYLREWVDNEVYRTLGYPSMTPYGQRQAHFLPDNPAELGPQGEMYHVLEMREDHRKKIESLLQEGAGPAPRTWEAQGTDEIFPR